LQPDQQGNRIWIVAWWGDPEAFAGALTRFSEGLAEAAREEGVIALDGKGLRAAFARAKGACAASP
jgi:hypothetical protein